MQSLRDSRIFCLELWVMLSSEGERAGVMGLPRCRTVQFQTGSGITPLRRKFLAWQIAAISAVAGSCHRNTTVAPPWLLRPSPVPPPSLLRPSSDRRWEVERRKDGGATEEPRLRDGVWRGGNRTHVVSNGASTSLTGRAGRSSDLPDVNPASGALGASPEGLTDGSRWSARARGADHRTRGRMGLHLEEVPEPPAQ